MLDMRRSLAKRPSGWKKLALYAAVLGVVLCFVLPGSAIFGGSTAQALPAPRVPVDQLQIQRAEDSFARGGGPSAAYGPCAVTDGDQVACGSAAAPHPLTSNPSAPKSWTDLTTFAGSGPAPRWLGGMTWDPVDHYVVLFGGYDATAGTYSDTWSFANDTWTELSPTTAPAGRYAFGMTWDYKDGYAVLFGGYALTAGDPAYNDTWTFVHGQWTNVTPAAPTASNNPADRWRPAMSWDGADNYVLMFGGTNNLGSTIYADTWSFTGGVWSKVNASGSPPGRYRAAMTYDYADKYVVIFGGCTSAACSPIDTTTWSYSGGNWTKLNPTTHPSGRIYFGITYSDSYDHVILFGGDSSVNEPPTGTALGDTWAFAGGNWTDLTSNLSKSPNAVSYLMLAFDPLDNLTLMFGGVFQNGTFSGDSWGLGPSILGRVSLSSSAIDKGQSFNINATPVAYSKWVAYNYTTLPPGCASLNESVLTCQPSTVGRFPISVVLNDSTGTYVTEQTNVTVNADPSVTSFGVSPTTVTRGSPVHFTVTGANGTLPYSYKYVSLPPGCSSGNTAALTCTPGATAFGPYIVEVMLTDAAQENRTATVDLTVNAQPSFTSFVARPGTVDVGQTLNLYANATGGTGPFTFSYTGLPAGCASVNASVVTCQPSASGTGFHPVQVKLVDAFNWSTTFTTNVTVNSDPMISGATASPSPVDVGTPFTLQVNASGGSGLLSYSYTNTPSGCSFGNHSTISCTPSSSGTWHIDASVTDAAGFTVNTTVTLVVSPALTFVGLTASPAALDANQNVTLTFAYTGGTAPITVSWEGLPTGCVASGNSATLTCAPRQGGTSTLAVTATDHFKQVATGSLQLIVYADPTIASFTAGSGTTTVGTATTISVTTSGGSGGYSFSFTGLPAGCSSSNTSSLSCTPTKSGTYNITVTATDSNGKSTTSYVNLVVNAAAGSGSSGSNNILIYAALGAVILVLAIGVAVVLTRGNKPKKQRPAEWAEEPAAEANPPA